ncbi:DUF4406 domain-containing protein [Rhodospirillaceae bacterium SYSU D60014]|uniref:DUF4406 domain-containing protein n=1 Tax=Virgifigura deserti TaxID=2268457 RepID=UPI000E66E81F
MWIMIAGSYTAGGADAARRAANLRAMNEAAVTLFRAGHVPIIGVNLALPLIEAADGKSFDEMMMPMSLAVAERCDACLRISGPSKGADEEVQRFRSRNLPIYFRPEDVPSP